MENFRLNKIKDKMKLVKTKITTTIKATFLAGLMVSATGCKETKVEKTEEPTTTEIIMEAEPVEPATEIETTVEKMLKTTTTTTKAVKKTETHSYEEPTTEEQIEEATEEPTTLEETTEAPTATTKEKVARVDSSKVAGQVVKPYGNNRQTEEPTNVTSTTKKSTTTTTTKATTTTKKPTTTTTTKKATTTTTTTTTQEPTTEPVTEPITEAPTEQQVTYDYTLENITQSADVFNYFANDLNSRVLHGASVLLYDCNNNQYWTYGDKEAKVAMLLMNDNLTYNNGVLSKAFEGYSDYDIKNGADYFLSLPGIESCTEFDIDFNEYTNNKNLGDYMNNLKNAARIARETGNCDELNKVLGLILYDENYQYLWNNYAALMLTIGYGIQYENNDYYGTYAGFVSGNIIDDYENCSYEMVKNHTN